MKNSLRITLALATVVTAAIILYAVRRINTSQMMVKVSNEGYETARDILFPGKKIAERKFELGLEPLINEATRLFAFGVRTMARK